MPRNLDTRVELLVPIEKPELRAEIDDTLERCMADDTFSWVLGRRRALDTAAREHPLRARGADGAHAGAGRRHAVGPAVAVWEEPAGAGTPDLSSRACPGSSCWAPSSPRRVFPPPPLSRLTGLKLVEVGLGSVVFEMPLTRWLLSPQGAISIGPLDDARRWGARARDPLDAACRNRRHDVGAVAARARAGPPRGPRDRARHAAARAPDDRAVRGDAHR